jgi:hypothetical protein
VRLRSGSSSPNLDRSTFGPVASLTTLERMIGADPPVRA